MMNISLPDRVKKWGSISVTEELKNIPNTAGFWKGETDSESLNNLPKVN